MNQGDVVRYQNELWFVQSVDPYRLGVAVLDRSDPDENHSRTVCEVPFDLDASGEVEVLANPSREWPFISPPSKGPVQRVTLIRGAAVEELTPYLDWVAVDTAIFYRPSLKPRLGDLFNVTFSTSSVRITVTRQNLKTVQSRIDTMKRPPPVTTPPNAYRMLLQDDDDDQD